MGAATILGTQRSVGAVIQFQDGVFGLRGVGPVTYDQVWALDQAGDLEWDTGEVHLWFYDPATMSHFRVPSSAATGPAVESPSQRGDSPPNALLLPLSAALTAFLVFLFTMVCLAIVTTVSEGKGVIPGQLLVAGLCVAGGVAAFLLSGHRVVTSELRGIRTRLFGLPVWAIIVDVLIAAALVAALTVAFRPTVGQAIPPSSVLVNGETFPVREVQVGGVIQRGDKVEVKPVDNNGDGKPEAYDVTKLVGVAGQ